jgi:signal peptidase II
MPEDLEGASPPPRSEAGGEEKPPAAADSQYTPSYVFLVVVTFVNLAADLFSKYWAKEHFETALPGEAKRLVVIDGVMNFIFAKNRGGAWGLLQNENEALRRPFFLVVSVAAIVFIVSLYRKLQPGQTALKWGLPLVLGGALGNLVDRIRYGYVVDFIDVYMSYGGEPKHWPTFNIADVSICVGVGLMAIDMFTSRERNRSASKAAQERPTSDDDDAPGSQAPRDEKKDVEEEPRAASGA